MTSKLVFVAPAAYPLGGLASWLDDLVPGLRESGFQVEVLLTAGRWHDVATYAREHPGLDFTTVHCRSGTREGRVRALTRVLGGRGADLVIVVNVPDTYAAVDRLRAARAFPPRCAMTIHAIEPEFFDDLRDQRDVIDCAIATNQLACALSVELSGWAPERVFYAPYGVEMPVAVRTHRGGERMEILFAGRLEEDQKRVSLLPPLVERLESTGVCFRLSVAGDGPDGAGLARELAPARERGSVRWLGAVERERLVREVLPEHDLFLLTSAWETGPIAIWEAMAAGLAVVSSRYLGSGLEHALIDRKNCRLFEIDDVEGAARAIRDLVPAERRAEIARRGRQLIEHRYSREASVAAWSEACRRALALDPSRPSGRRAIPPAGRLDRALGVRLAESIRALAGSSFQHTGPGGEWPHSYGSRSELCGFVERASALDRRAR